MRILFTTHIFLVVVFCVALTLCALVGVSRWTFLGVVVGWFASIFGPLLYEKLWWWRYNQISRVLDEHEKEKERLRRKYSR